MTSVRFTQSSMRSFQDLLNETVRATGRDVRLQIRLNARDYLRKVIKLTPMVRKGKLKKFAINKAGKWYLLPKDKWQKIKGRGFARSGWLVALSSLGLRYSTSDRKYAIPNGKWKRAGTFRNRLKETLPAVELGNIVPFIETLNSRGGTGGQRHFFQKAFDATIREMRHRLDAMATKAWRGWR